MVRHFLGAAPGSALRLLWPPYLPSPSFTEFRKVRRKNAGSMLRLLRLSALEAKFLGPQAVFFEDGAWTFAKVSRLLRK